MKDLLENENGMLDQGYFSPEQIEMRNIASGLTQRPPMVPTSPLEDRLMRRTMNAVPQQMGAPSPEAGASPPGEAGYRSYESPRQALRNQRQNALAERMQYQQGELSKKLNNPFFKVTDFVADVARNTIGLPMNMVTGGTGFTYDPSNDARTTTRSRLENLEDLQFANNELYQTGVESRATAMEDMTNKQRTAEINAMNATSAANPFNKVNPSNFTPESLAQFDATARAGLPDYGVLQSNVKTVVKEDPVSGRMGIYRLNVDGEDTFLRFADLGLGEGLDQKGRIKNYENWTTASNAFHDKYDTVTVASRSRGRKLKTVTNAIAKAKDLINGKMASGWGGVWRDLPNSDANALRGYLNTIKGNIGFQELRSLKDSGATLGQVAVMELEALQAIMGDLEQNLPAKVLLETLDDVEGNYREADKNQAEQFNLMFETYGSRSQPKSNPYGSGNETGQLEGRVTTDSINTTGATTGAKEVINFENGSTIQY
jgi:hypothetical protein|tara:strand:- start:264 stop:1724 length:1461 start_codon:yes stop_codon:yes gene_type:complete